MLDGQPLSDVKKVVKVAQRLLRTAIGAAKKTLEPFMCHPSAFAKMVRFTQGFQEPAEDDQEYLEMATMSTCH